MGSKKQQKPKEPQKQTSGTKGAEKILGEAVPAVVEEIIGRTGFRGEITQVKCRVLQGYERGKVMRRNVKGSVRLKDVLMLRETAIEARKIKSQVTKGAFS